MVIKYEVTNKRNEGQHTVPAFILRNFNVKDTFGENARVYVFDKEINEMRSSPINVNKIAKEKGFYVYMDNEIKTIERSLAKLEGEASKVVNKIVREKSLGGLTEEERSFFSEFIMVQTVRTRLPREALAEHFKEQGSILDNDEIIRLSIDAMVDAEKCASFINDKIWLLSETSESKPFYISDHPVVFSGGPYPFDLGFDQGNTKGIELYFPISKTLCLVILCQSYEKQLLKRASIFKPLMKGLKTGCSVPMHEKTVIYHNMLQVDFALKEVYSSTNSFDIAREMIANARSH